MEVGFSVLLPVVSALTQLSRIALAASVRRWVVEPVESRVPRSGEQGRLSPGHPLKECTGYQDNGRDTDDQGEPPVRYLFVVRARSLSVLEATTGEELGATELSGGSFRMRASVVRRHHGEPPASTVSCIQLIFSRAMRPVRIHLHPLGENRIQLHHPLGHPQDDLRLPHIRATVNTSALGGPTNSSATPNAAASPDFPLARGMLTSAVRIPGASRRFALPAGDPAKSSGSAVPPR